jgi:16S rRNA (uracil1498-N3)-methyltransferase
VERDDLASLAGFFCATAALASGDTITLGEDAAHHARVRRLAVDDRVFIADGAGMRAVGAIVRTAKNEIDVAIETVTRASRLPDVHLIVPIADRDRMLWCAEKCTELGATSWRPVLWHRSRSVSPRGEGPAFRDRVMARMRSALVQAHAAWLPDVLDDCAIDQMLERLPDVGDRLVLEASGEPIAARRPAAPVAIAIGPEGGFESAELQRLRGARFRTVSIGANVLRFETAALAALAIVRAGLDISRESTNGG